jgi:L-arabinose isomerase
MPGQLAETDVAVDPMAELAGVYRYVGAGGTVKRPTKEGPAIATSLIDLGDRFRLLINEVECKKTEKPMPKLPVATAFWTPKPDFKTGAQSWILAGGAHHTAFSYDLSAEQMGDWAEAMGIEAVYIDADTTIRQLKNELRWNELAYRR